MKIHPYIRYPNNRAISEYSFEFIKNSLEFEESKRMSWEDAMKSYLFKQFIEVNHKVIENKSNFIEKLPLKEESHI